jgi:hypothetical protein
MVKKTRKKVIDSMAELNLCSNRAEEESQKGSYNGAR